MEPRASGGTTETAEEARDSNATLGDGELATDAEATRVAVFKEAAGSPGGKEGP